MDDARELILTLIRWTAPVVGLVVSFLAWRRFKPPGVRLAVAGFAVMLIGPVVRFLVLDLFRDPFTTSARDISLTLTIIGMFSGLGVVLIVIAMNRLINAANPAISIRNEPGPGDES